MRAIGIGMQLRYIALAMGIVAILLISGCTQEEKMSFECDYLSMGWVAEFASKYYVMPKEAIQCDNEKGSFVVLKVDLDMAGDIASRMTEELIDKAVSDQLDYYDEICSTSKSFCAKGLVASGGKINTANKLDNERLAIIVVNSDKPSDVVAFLEGFWQNRNPTVS